MTKKPTTSHMAQMAAGSYTMGNKKSKKENTKQTNKDIEKTNFVVNHKLSDSGVTVYQHKDDKNHVVVAHRGTAVGGRKGMKDLMNDATLSLGINAGHKKRFNQRKRTTEKAIRELKPTQLHITGHSLGGGTANHAVNESKLIRDNLTSLHTFNGAATLKSQKKLSKAEQAKLKGKVTHHRIKSDVVSISSRAKPPLGGKVKTTTMKKAPVKKKSLGRRLINLHPAVKVTKGAKTSLDSHSIDNFIKK